MRLIFFHVLIKLMNRLPEEEKKDSDDEA
jgi:hypothetical protein